MTRRGRGLVLAAVVVWAGMVAWLAVAGALGSGRVPLWEVSVCSLASAAVGYALCGLLNHSP